MKPKLRKKNIQQLILLVSACLTLLLGCSYEHSSSVKDNVLVFCSEASPQSFNPQLTTSGTTFDATSRQIYNRLIEFEPGTNKITSGLATRWELSNDGKEYTFHLRRGVQFQATNYFKPSRSFNADDVLFSFQRQWKKDHPFHFVSPLGFPYFESMGLNELIKDIVKIDQYTIKFILNSPNAPFLSTLAMDFTSILSSEYSHQLILKGHLDLIDNQPIGTGPFQLTRYQADAFIRYKAHPRYWKGKEALSELVFAITPDPSLRFARLIAGECDIMAKPLPIQIKASVDYPELTSLSMPSLNISYMAMNTKIEPFNDKRVRQALNYAINKKALLEIVYGGTAQAAKNPIPPNMWSYNKETKTSPYSPKRAKELLTQAGYEDGFKMELWAMPIQRSYNPNAIKMAELIQQDLQALNIETKIVSYQLGTMIEKIRQKQHQAVLLGWIGDNSDPDSFLSSLLSCSAIAPGNNASNWCDREFDLLIKLAKQTHKIKTRTELYKKAQERFVQGIPWVPIAHSRQYVLTNKRVKGFALSPTDGMYFSGVSLKSQKKHFSDKELN